MGMLKQFRQDAIDSQTTVEIASSLHDRMCALIGINEVPTGMLQDLCSMMEHEIVNRLAAASGYIDDSFMEAV